MDTKWLLEFRLKKQLNIIFRNDIDASMGQGPSITK